MEDAPVLLLKKHRNPATREGKKTYLRQAEQHADRSSVAGAALRALRLIQRDFTSEDDPEPSSSFHEVSPNTPWSKYGTKFVAGISQYKTVYLHLETDKKGRPTLLILGALNNTTLAVKLLHDAQATYWDSFEKSFPRLAAILKDTDYLKLTTTFRLTKRFLKIRKPTAPDKLVDVLFLANTLRNSDFFHVKKYRHCDERIAGLCLIWSTLGEHKGPITFADWDDAFGNGVPFPARRKEDRLLRWPKAHRREYLTRSQIIYAEQLAQAANTISVHYFLWAANYGEMVRPVEDFGRTFEDCLERSYGESLTDGDGWLAKYNEVREGYIERRVAEPSPPSRVRFESPRVDDYEPSVPREHQEAGYHQEVVEIDEYDPELELMQRCERLQRDRQLVDPFACSDDVQEGPSHLPSSSPSDGVRAGPSHWPTTSGSDDVRQGPSHSPPPSDNQPVDHTTTVSHRDHVDRGDHNAGDNTTRRRDDAHRSTQTRAARNKRMEINRKRLQYRANHANEFVADFLGKNACTTCGEEPRHKDPNECPVEYFKKYGKMPKQCSLPCHYCDSFEHITDACEYLHMRCVRCGFRGHMAFECHERTTEEWLIAYLNCVHLGKWTRRNADGPMRGRFGFGDTSQLDLSLSTKQFISTKRNSLRFVRHKELAGQPSCDSTRELSAAWDNLHRQEQDLKQRRRDFEKEKEIFYRQQDKFNAERRQMQVVKRRAVSTTNAATQTGELTDAVEILVPFPNSLSSERLRGKITKSEEQPNEQPEAETDTRPEPGQDEDAMEDDVLELHVEEYFV